MKPRDEIAMKGQELFHWLPRARAAFRWPLAVLLVVAVAVGCRAPFLLPRTTIPGAAARGPVDDGVHVAVGTPVSLPSRSAADAGDPALPATLAGKPYGAVAVSITWPARPRYSAQTIPTAANSLRFRIIGDDGKDRLAVWFFRPPNGQLTATNQIFFLPVQTGMYVEVRAYAQTQAQLAPPVAAPPYNPPNMPDYAAKDSSGTNLRVLAEGLQFNFAVTVLKSTPVQVTLDSTQLVAGIGGTGGFDFGGDPYFNNFLEDARFAEMTLPGGLFYDHYGPKNAANSALGQRDRLIFLDYPNFLNVPLPLERDLVEILTSDALQGTADTATGSAVEPVKLQLGGGSAPVPEANGDGNAPTFAIVNNPAKLAYNAAADSLYILEATTSATLNNIRILSPATDSANAAVNSDSLFDGYLPGTPAGLVSLSTVPGSSRIMAADRTTRKIDIDLAQPGTQAPSVLAGGGTATPSATTATSSIAIAFTGNLQAVAAASASDFLVLDGEAVVRSVDGQARVVAGVGTITPGGSATAADADTIAFGTGVDMVYDSTDTYAYIADEFNQKIYRLGPMPSTLGAAVPFQNVSLPFLPVALAVSTNNNAAAETLYALASDGRVFSIGNAGSVSPGVPSTVLGSPAGFTYTGLACETIAGSDELFLATSEGGGNVRWAHAGGTTTRLFGGGSLDLTLATPDLTVGDGANLTSSIVNGSRRSGAVQLTGSGYLNGPSYITADSTGDLYVADTRNDRIREILVDPDHTDNPTQILSLYRSDPSLNPPQIVVDTPQGVDVDEYGDVFVSNTGFNTIDVWRPHVDPYESTSEFRIAGTSTGGYNDDDVNALLVQLKAPTAIRVERHASPTDGTPSRRRIFFLDSGNKRVRMLSPVNPAVTAPCRCPNDPYFQYIISTVVGGGSGGDGTNAAQAALSGPEDLAVSSNGYLYIADGPNIRRVDPVTGSISTIYTASGSLGSITVNDVNNELYFTLQGRMTIRKIPLPQ